MLRRSACIGSRRSRHRPFLFELLEERALLAVLVRDGGGDSVSWNDALHWSGDVIPTLADDVVIDDPSETLNIGITGSASAKTVNSSENLVVNAGTLTTESLSVVDLTMNSGGQLITPTGQSMTLVVSGSLTIKQSANPFIVTGSTTVSGSLSMDAGAALIADGALASFQADGETTIHGADVIAQNGGQVRLPLATSYVHSSSTNNQTRSLVAEGAGSRLELLGLTALVGGTHFNSDVWIEATAGGHIDLSSMTQIADPSSGDTRHRSVSVTADGAGSTIDVSSLSYFHDGSSDVLSILSAANQGSVLAAGLQVATGVHIDLDGSGTLPATHMQRLVNSRVDVSGMDQTFGRLRSASNTSLWSMGCKQLCRSCPTSTVSVFKLVAA